MTRLRLERQQAPSSGANFGPAFELANTPQRGNQELRTDC
jgi:hypothetical protein